MDGDVDARHETPFARGDEEVAHATFLAQAAAPVVVVDQSLIVVYANHAAGELFGVHREELAASQALKWLPGLRSLAPRVSSRPPADALFDGHAGRTIMAEALAGSVRKTLEIGASRATHSERTYWVLALRDVSTLESTHQDLLKAHKELADFKRMAVGRELRMLELKIEVNAVLAARGEPLRYADAVPPAVLQGH